MSDQGLYQLHVIFGDVIIRLAPMIPNKKFKLILNIFFQLVIIFVVIFISVKNYTPGTYLIGWDSMHPEFNFPLNVSRMLSHVWGAEMGVGAISAHSDMSDLPRLLVLWLVSALVSMSFVRYFYIFSSLILGPLGMFFFLKYVFQKEKDSPWVYVASFLGSLFYLLNLGTLQNFYVPLEMFTTAFAGVPWVVLFGLKYLREGKKKNLLLFSLIIILISPIAYAATQAYAIYFGLFLFLLSFAVFSSGKKLKLKRFLSLGIVALLLNIYWILPNIYSVVQQSLTISNANINRLFSPESFLRNADYGDIKNVLIQKSFLFGWRNFDFPNDNFKDLLNVWDNHLVIPAVSAAGYVLALLTVAGILVGLVKREKVSLSFIPPLLLSLFFLFNINPPAGKLYYYLYNHFGVFSEGFRTPFTKFSVLFEFILAYYFGYFCYLLLTIKIKFTAVFKILVVGAITVGLIYFFLPAFYGELIGPNVRVNFPSEYKELFDWFEDNPEGRIALMPINTKYGWEYRNWGYEGSGFLTYGISNPILYRDFDRWNSANEDFFNQASFALYSGNSESFVSTLKKYQIRFILLDESIMNAGGTSDILKIPQIKNIAENYQMTPVANFGFLTVYDTGFGKSDMSSPKSYSKIDADLSYSPIDPIYLKNGDYVREGMTTYPFISLDKRSGVKIRIENGSVEFKNSLFNSTLDFPATNSARANLLFNQGFPDAFNCDLKKLGTVSKEIGPFGVLYRALKGGVACDYIDFPDLKYREAYVLRVTGENRSGRSLKIYLFDSISQVPYLEEILPTEKFDETYFIYPRDLEGEGYILNFETRSFGRVLSENLLTGVEFYSVDYESLAGLKNLDLQGADSIKNNLKTLNVRKFGNSLYKVNLQGSGLIQLGQGYDNGWVAFRISNPLRGQDFKPKFFEHVKVNSWANGWQVQSDSPSPFTVYLFYWPQVLEWGGLALGVIILTWLIIGLY